MSRIFRTIRKEFLGEKRIENRHLIVLALLSIVFFILYKNGINPVGKFLNWLLSVGKEFEGIADLFELLLFVFQLSVAFYGYIKVDKKMKEKKTGDGSNSVINNVNNYYVVVQDENKNGIDEKDFDKLRAQIIEIHNDESSETDEESEKDGLSSENTVQPKIDKDVITIPGLKELEYCVKEEPKLPEGNKKLKVRKDIIEKLKKRRKK